jgi:NitT/TauT family transport system substrate-binding protein
VRRPLGFVDATGAATRLAVLAVLLAAMACAPAAGSAPAAGAPAAPAAAQAASGSAAASIEATRPALTTTPAVQLKVGVLPLSSFAGHYIAQERGYFQEVGLDVEFFSSGNANSQLASLMQGQIQAGSCSVSIGCFNAMSREPDVRIVADLSSAGKTEKSIGSGGLVVRKDLWDSGVILAPRDLIGRSIYTISGRGSGQHVLVARWLLAHGIDPGAVEWPQMLPADLFLAMQNQAIELGVQTEPLASAGMARGVHQVLASNEDMNPSAHLLYLVYHTSIERLGPQVGERFMVAYLRGVRDYLNAFEYGVDQDAIIDVLARETVMKDPTVYRTTKYAWIDPNGVVNPAVIQADADLYHQLGVVTSAIDLGGMFDDRYQRFAVQYLGEYQPPR